MILPWIVAVCVPLLAVWGWAWLLEDSNVIASESLGDPVLLLIRFFLAAAPLVALAVFSLTRRALPVALETVALATGLVTLLIWGWYYMGAAGLSQDTTGLVLLVSPVAIGLLAVIAYTMVARREI